MSDQMSASDLESLVHFHADLGKLEPDDDQVYEQTEEEMLVDQTQVLEEEVEDSLMQGVVINENENEVVSKKFSLAILKHLSTKSMNFSNFESICVTLS